MTTTTKSITTYTTKTKTTTTKTTTPTTRMTTAKLVYKSFGISGFVGYWYTIRTLPEEDWCAVRKEKK